MEGRGGKVRILSIIDQWPFNAGEGADIEEVVGEAELHSSVCVVHTHQFGDSEVQR
jgi:hypothetical protein